MDRSRVARVAQLALKPVATWDSVSQVVVVVLFLLGSPTLLGITISLGYGLAILGFLIAALGLRAAWRIQSELDQRDALAPKLRFGAVEVTDPVDVHTVIQMGSTPLRGGVENARFVRVPVVNEQGNHEAAKSVYATLTFETMDGGQLRGPTPARWAETVQPPDRTLFATLDDPKLHEVSLEPNGRPHVLDVVLRFASDPPGYPGGCCYIWNNESATTGVRQDRFRIDAPEFRVRMEVQGNNVPKLVRVLHVEALTIPQAKWERE